MCTYYYLHHHHIPPCTRPYQYVVHYSFCQDATAITNTTMSTSGETTATTERFPCTNTHYDQSASIDHADPCASGGCLASPDCSSGACRVADLGGRWTCCDCGRSGNRYPQCYHPHRRSPDTLCYHRCCGRCWADGEKLNVKRL